MALIELFLIQLLPVRFLKFFLILFREEVLIATKLSGVYIGFFSFLGIRIFLGRSTSSQN